MNVKEYIVYIVYIVSIYIYTIYIYYQYIVKSVYSECLSECQRVL